MSVELEYSNTVSTESFALTMPATEEEEPQPVRGGGKWRRLLPSSQKYRRSIIRSAEFDDLQKTLDRLEHRTLPVEATSVNEEEGRSEIQTPPHNCYVYTDTEDDDDVDESEDESSMWTSDSNTHSNDTETTLSDSNNDDEKLGNFLLTKDLVDGSGSSGRGTSKSEGFEVTEETSSVKRHLRDIISRKRQKVVRTILYKPYSFGTRGRALSFETVSTAGSRDTDDDASSDLSEALSQQETNLVVFETLPDDDSVCHQEERKLLDCGELLNEAEKAIQAFSNKVAKVFCSLHSAKEERNSEEFLEQDSYTEAPQTEEMTAPNQSVEDSDAIPGNVVPLERQPTINFSQFEGELALASQPDLESESSESQPDLEIESSESASTNSYEESSSVFPSLGKYQRVVVQKKTSSVSPSSSDAREWMDSSDFALVPSTFEDMQNETFEFGDSFFT